MNSRRDFLKTGGFAALGLSLPFSGRSSLFDASYKKLSAFGIQLWTVQGDMGKDPKDTLKKLASYGYKQIESFEGRNGMFWGLGHKGFKSYMDELDMKIISSHCNYTNDFERKAAEAAEIGMKYLICPWLGPQKSIDDFKKAADSFNKAGEICKKNGIRFAYHNHDYSFKPLNGEVPQDVMMQGTDKDLVDYEMDIYWVVAANEDPKAWLKKYSGRFTACHVKDLGRTDKGHESVHLGKGTIDFKDVLSFGKKHGLKYYIVEQEAFTGSTPIQSADVDAQYMKTLSI